MKEIVITLQKNELKYDVKFDTWLKDRSFNQQLRNSNKDADKVSLSYEDKAEMWLARQVHNAIGRIHGELAWAVCEENESKLQKDGINEVPEQWQIHLKFNDDWCGSPRSMNTYAHQYVVAIVLYNWYRSIGDASWQIYKAESDEALEYLYMEARSERVKPEPFRL